MNSCGLVDDLLVTMHARIQKVLPEGSNSDIFLFVCYFDEGREEEIEIQIVL